MKRNKRKQVSKIMVPTAIIIFIIALTACFYFIWQDYQNLNTNQTRQEPASPIIDRSTTTPNIIKKTQKKLNKIDYSIYHPHYIAHAGGDYNGHKHTNSLEALNHSYARGLRYFEIDFSTTEDGKIVLLHDWHDTFLQYFSTEPGPVTEELFLNTTTTVGFTPLNLIGLKTWLLNHPDTYIIADTKENSYKVWSQLAKETIDMRQRFIPQVYEVGQYFPIKNLGFDKSVLALYMHINTDDEILNFVSSTPNIWAVSLPRNYSTIETIIPKLKNMNAYIYVHVVENIREENKWKSIGSNGFYTTLLRPN